MKISFQPNASVDSKQIPYQIHIEIDTLTIDTGSVFNVPMHIHGNGRTLYNAEVCGFRVEGREPDEVVNLVSKLMSGLVNMARLPTYIFIARRSHQMYPVYTVGDEVLVTTPGGPAFRHVELAKVRDYLSDYLHLIGELGVPGKSEKLHVRGVSRKSLTLVRPIFYLKKRPMSDDENEFWAPVFISSSGDSIYTYAASGRREVDMNGGREALLLQSQVAQALIADKRLKDTYNLRIDRLLPEYWQTVKATLEAHPANLVYDDPKLGKIKMDLYRNGKFVVAVEHRRDEERYSLFLGHDETDLADHATQDLVRRGFITNPNSIRIEN
ncbi:MAG: hypothetical protein HC875_21250 [Anaerolineales bacterium]|nr:hypothetical protein [Anaerolineales bacterium]